jgi:drug/metabolite transporter (DMT)-like permease
MRLSCPRALQGQFALSLALLALTALWGWTFSAVKGVVEHYGVLQYLALRFAIAVIVLAPVAARRTTWQTWLYGLPVGAALGAGYLLQTFGVQHTSASNNGLITGLFVVFAPICNWAIFGVKTKPIFWFSVLLSVSGLGLLTGSLGQLSIGDVLTLIGAVCFGLHVALLDRYTTGQSALGLAWTQLAIAFVVVAAGLPFAGPLVAPSSAVLAPILVLAVVATAGAFAIQTLCQRELPAVRAAVMLSMEPVFSAVFGYLVAGDRLRPIQFAGAGLMVLAVGMAEVVPALERARQRSQEA